VSTLDQKRLDTRAEARRQANAAVDLIMETIVAVGDEEWRTAFWDEIRDELALRCSEEETPAPCVPACMSDEEARIFRLTSVPFGKHKGQSVDDAPHSWFDWLLGQRDEFKEKLARYMAREDSQERLRRELGDA